MDNDDKMIGRFLTRRELIAALGATGAATVTALLVQKASKAQSALEPAAYLPIIMEDGSTATPTPTPITPTATPITPTPTATPIPSCVVRPEVTEGPYFVDEMLNRSDIRSDPDTGVISEGELLALTFNVSQIGNNSCAALPNAQVDVWHCDAYGLYSDIQSEGTAGQKFLRGFQMTDNNGVAQFVTIYPGWYRGRTVHIHFKIRLNDGGINYEFTSQLFFDDDFTAQVYAAEPYASEGLPDTLNSADNIYDSRLEMTVTQTTGGYAATFDIGLQI